MVFKMDTDTILENYSISIESAEKISKFLTYLDTVEGKDETFIENNGIGSYEYWGYSGYDKGVDYIEGFFTIRASIDRSLYTKGEFNIIIEIIKDIDREELKSQLSGKDQEIIEDISIEYIEDSNELLITVEYTADIE